MSGGAWSGDVARAHDHRAPTLTMRVESLRQRGIPREVWWTQRASKDECVTSNAVGPGDFPQSLEVGPGRTVRIRLQKRHRPKDVFLTQWRGARVGEQVTLGPSSELEFDLRRQSRGTRRAWEVIFDRPDPGEYFYEISAAWSDRNGCRDEQGGFWRFSLTVGL